MLDEELGLEPSAELRDLQTAVLRQDPALEWVAPAAGPGGTPLVPAPVPSERRHPRPRPSRSPPWPMVGRDADLAALIEAW